MWAHLINTLLGVWLMAAPDVLDYGDPAETADRIVGPLLTTFACIAIWEVTRPCRWITLAGGVWLLVAPWLLGYETRELIHSVMVGAVISGLSLVAGRQNTRFGGGWRVLWTASSDPDIYTATTERKG